MPDLAQIIESMEMTISGVMKEARTSDQVLRQAIAGIAPSRNVQLKLEAVLDQPLWSTPAQFSQRRKLRKFLGCEPLLLNTRQLLLRVRKVALLWPEIDSDIPSLAKASKDKLISALAAIVQQVVGEKPLDPLLLPGHLWRCRACSNIFESNGPVEMCPSGSCCSLRVCRVGG